MCSSAIPLVSYDESLLVWRPLLCCGVALGEVSSSILKPWRESDPPLPSPLPDGISQGLFEHQPGAKMDFAGIQGVGEEVEILKQALLYLLHC